MNRRSALAAIAGGMLVRGEPRFRTYARCLPDYLRVLAREAYERRNSALAELTTAEAVRRRQAWVRDTFWQLVGGMPERTPLNTRITGSFERPSYRVEKMVYETRPGLEVAANLYIPAGQGPFPGVLFQMGHSLNGKAADTYQKCCQGLARLGYLVLAFDPMGQGERTYYRINDADEEHSRFGRQALLVGDTATRAQVWDAVRSMDVLAAHPLVDPQRIGSTGQSGGATLTMLLAAADDRLACAVVSSGNTENFAYRDFDPPGSTDDAEQDFVGAGPLGFDRWDLLYPLAPKPLAVLVSERDFFGTYSPAYIRNGEEEFAKLRRVYDVLGHSDRVSWGTTALPHALAHPMRIQVYNFFERWLRNSTRTVVEPEVKPEPESVLKAGARASLPPLASPAPRAIQSGDIAGLLRMGPLTGAPLRSFGRERGEACDIETIEVESEAGVFLPAYVFLPPNSAPKRPVLLLAHSAGRTSRWAEGSLCQQLAAEGFVVCAFDVRGVGDLRPEVPRGNPAYARNHAGDESFAWASLMLGRPLAGQRVADILAMTRAMGHANPGREIVLAAYGFLAVPALCAAAMETRVASTYLCGGLISWASLLGSESYTEPFSNFVPGVLNRTDLPYLAQAIRPRKLILGGPVNGRGEAVDAETVQKAYGPDVEVRTAAAWEAEVFRAI